MADQYINADTGNDSTGDGSSGNPWLTMGKGYTEATDGDTVYLQAATAHYSLSTRTFTKGLTFEGVNTDARDAVVDAANAATYYLLGTYDHTWKNLTLTRYNVNFNYDATFSVKSNQTLDVINCIIHDIRYDNSTTGYGQQGFFRFSYEAVGTSNSTVNLTNCLLYDHYAVGSGTAGNIPRFFNYYTAVANNVANITGCTFYTNDALGLLSDGGWLQGGNNASIIIKNTIFSNKTTAYTIHAGTGITQTYSCFDNCTGTYSGTGNITSDPLFVDPDNANFNLRPTSPCIDTGVLV